MSSLKLRKSEEIKSDDYFSNKILNKRDLNVQVLSLFMWKQRTSNNQQYQKIEESYFLKREINYSCQLLESKCVRISPNIEALVLFQGRLVGVDKI